MDYLKKTYPVERRKTISMKIWLYISRPFQITRLLELLYMLDWILYAVLSFFPAHYTNGVLFETMHDIMPHTYVNLALTLIALIHVYASSANVIWLRKIILLFNIGVLFYIASAALQVVPFSTGIEYLIILIGVTAFAFWRMDEKY